jgi:hypothetical protein
MVKGIGDYLVNELPLLSFCQGKPFLSTLRTVDILVEFSLIWSKTGAK